MKSLLKRLFAVFGVLLVILVVVTALGLTVVRLVLAGADGYRGELIAWLSEELRQPVEVAAIDARLYGLQPTLLLQEVRLLDPQGGGTLLAARELRVGIDPWSSLARGEVTLGLLTVVGAELSLRRDAAGGFEVEGLMLSKESEAKGERNPAAALEWLLSQSRLVIRESTIHWRGAVEERPIRFDIARIELHNKGRRHRLDGIVTLPENWGKRIRIGVDFRRNGASFREGSGKFYINGLGLRLEPLLSALPRFPAEKGSGQLDGELWGQWTSGRLTSLVGEIGVRELALHRADGGGYQLDLLNASLYWKQDADRWELNLPRLKVIRGERAWPDTRVRLRWQGGKRPRYQLQSSFLRLEDLAALIRFAPREVGFWEEAIAALAPRGDLTDFHLELHPSEHSSLGEFSLATRFHDVGLRAWGRLPGVTGVSGLLWVDENGGAVQLASDDGALDFPRLARHVWRFERLEGELNWQRARDGWHVTGQRLWAENGDLKAAAALGLLIPGKGVPPFLDLQVHFRDGRIRNAFRYYPVTIMPEKLVHWLEGALKGGRVPHGSLVFHGRLKKGLFPYRNGEGVFEVGFETRNVHLEYLKGWPSIEGLAGEVVFRGAGMRVDAREGRIMRVGIAGTHVRIDDYRDMRLIVLGQARGKGMRMLDFLRESPLAREADPVLARMKVSGDTVLGLYLSIPFAGRPVVYRGTVTLNDNRFRYQTERGDLEMANLAGRVTFDPDGYRAESLAASILGRPAKIRVTTFSGKEGVVTRIAAEGRFSPDSLAERLRMPLLRRLRGESSFHAELDFNTHRAVQGAFLVLRLNSPLTGITSTLPPPLEKPAKEEAWPLSIVWDDASHRVRFRLGDRVAGDIGLGSDGSEPVGNGYLHFGEGSSRSFSPTVLRITGTLQDFSFSDWVSLLRENRSFTDGFDREGPRLELELERLHLRPPRETARAVGRERRWPLEPRRLPVVVADIRELVYDATPLGRLTFAAHPTASGMLVERLVLTAPYMRVEGRVQWLGGRRQRVLAILDLTAPETQPMLEALGFSAMLQARRLRIDGKLEWPGSPADFALATLRGRLHLRIGEGRIESVEPGAGRLFGLFSLQALPRRLTLDFRDLFGKGFRFDSIRGDILLEEGNAITRDLLLEGPAARIAVSGRTGYVARDYDQRILVIPGDGSNLFVAGALALGPQTGALIWMAEKLLRLDKVARYVYHVTGTWENPVITRGREKEKGSPPGGGDVLP